LKLYLHRVDDEQMKQILQASKFINDEVE
jgi:hypothetical protein